MGKGSKPRNCFSSNFKGNYEEIEWRKKGTYCQNCGKNFSEKEKRNLYKDGHATCIECNFN